MLRLDTRTGQVSLCAKKDTGWACSAVPDERQAYFRLLELDGLYQARGLRDGEAAIGDLRADRPSAPHGY